MDATQFESILNEKHNVGKRKLSLVQYTGSTIWLIEGHICGLHEQLDQPTSDLDDDERERVENAIASLDKALELINEAEGWLYQLEVV